MSGQARDLSASKEQVLLQVWIWMELDSSNLKKKEADTGKVIGEKMSVWLILYANGRKHKQTMTYTCMLSGDGAVYLQFLQTASEGAHVMRNSLWTQS